MNTEYYSGNSSYIERINTSAPRPHLQRDPFHTGHPAAVLDVVDQDSPIQIVDTSLAVFSTTEHQRRPLGTGQGQDFARMAPEHPGRLFHGQGKRQVHLPDAPCRVLARPPVKNMSYPQLYPDTIFCLGCPGTGSTLSDESISLRFCKKALTWMIQSV